MKITVHRAVLVGTMVTMLMGCSTYTPRTEVEPRIELRTDFTSTGAASTERWWTAFGDPELSLLIETALEDNLSLHMAWARLDQMRAVARAAGADTYPTIDLNVGVEQLRFDDNQISDSAGAPSNTINTSLAALTVGYQLDLWKKISNRRKAALFDQQSSREEVAATALTISGAAAELWFGIAADQANLHLLDEQLDVGEDVLDLVQLRFANGLASAVEVYQQRLQVESTRNQIPSTDTRLATRRHQLAVLLGREPRARTRLPAAALPGLPPLPATGVPIEVLRSRPDVKAAELRLMAADHRLAAAVADRYPSVSLGATVGGQASSFANVLDQWFVNLAGNLLAPLVDGGRRAAEAERNRAVVEERMNAWEAVLLAACAEVEDSLVTEHNLHETSRILSAQLELAEASMQRSRALYVNGLADYLTVLTALQSLQELQRQSIHTEHELVRNRVRLYLSLGGTWSENLMKNPSDTVEVQS